MLNLSHVFGDLFCIAILVTMIAGMISQRESEEKNAFLALIFTAMVYISLCLLEQFFASRILLPSLLSARILAVVSRVAAAELMHASLRYLYLVITGKTPGGWTFWIPVLSLLVLCVASIWTGWIFSIDSSLRVIPGPLYLIEFALTNCYPLVSTLMALYKWVHSKSYTIRLRCAIASSFVLPLLLTGLMEYLNPELQLKSFGITLAVTMVFIRLQKQSVTESILSLQIQRENTTRYRNTLLSTALQFMVVNLTRDSILELSVPRNPDITIESLIRDGRLPSIRYSDTVEIWCRNTVGISEEEKRQREARNAGEAVGMNQQVSDMALVQGQDNANGFASQLDVANIIKQIVEYSRVSIDNSATKMEMQLNPENLGKLYLEITAKDAGGNATDAPLTALGIGGTADFTEVKAQDAEIVLNDALFKSDSNTFSIITNGFCPFNFITASIFVI